MYLSQPPFVSASDRKYLMVSPRLSLLTALCGSALCLVAMGAHAQHAEDNAVTSADDGFGLTLGLESIGMYSPGQIRGFSPKSAGNLRIDGLYFDQQGLLSNRVIEGSAIRVGITEIGYAFPAPTGIVDYALRRPGDGMRVTSRRRPRASIKAPRSRIRACRTSRFGSSGDRGSMDATRPGCTKRATVSMCPSV